MIISTGPKETHISENYVLKFFLRNVAARNE